MLAIFRIWRLWQQPLKAPMHAGVQNRQTRRTRELCGNAKQWAVSHGFKALLKHAGEPATRFFDVKIARGAVPPRVGTTVAFRLIQ